MSTTDISRSAFDAKKHYAGVRMQQGRVIVDDDWNEGEVIGAEADRRALVDVIGPSGSPDQGFLIDKPKVTGGKIDFDILPGTFYAGGLRIDLEAKETFRVQADWLQQAAEAPAAPMGERFDLAYLEVWQQSVQAVEDGELFEVALGGPDTSTRVRTMARVRLATNVGTDDCPDAWAHLLGDWDALGRGAVSAEGELVPDVDLTVTYGPGGDPKDLCSPTVAGGYLGAENQAIRVQLVDATHLTWGFDNASPLYRVQVEADRKTVHLPAPRDQAHWPLHGQIVEVLGWGGVLPNEEKVAERTGHLSAVAASYSPDTGVITLQTPLPANFATAWKQRPDQADLAKPSEYLFLRVWDRGADRASPPAVTFTLGQPLALGDTGLLVTIDGPDRPAGTYWVIAARPETPSRVVPWQLEDGRGPNGTRTFVVPLGIIHWTGSGANVQGTVATDCRETFDPLTRQRGCCTYRVGDGTHSHGDFTSIQEAVDHLPSAGGEICVLPGVYEEHVVIEGRHDVVISGCGPRSRVVALDGDVDKGVFIVADSANVTIRSLAVEAPVCTGVRVIQTSGQLSKPVLGIALEDLTISVRDRAAVFVDAGTGVRVVGNTIRVLPLKQAVERTSDIGLWPAVFVAGEEVLIERNDIRVTSTEGLRRAALGGIQIGGGSVDVEIRRNRIEGGLGNGITLGSVVYVEEGSEELLLEEWQETVDDGYHFWPGWGYGVDEDGCLTTPTDDDPTDPEGNPLVPVSEGSLSGVRIVDNLIADMGSSGISVARFFSPEEHDVISVDRLSIETNSIRRCLRLGTPQLDRTMLGLVGFGGIALADCQDLLLRDNLVEGNGTGHIDPVCGVFALRTEGAVIVDNRIVDNGPLVRGDDVFRPGQRGGIVIGLALVQSSRSLSLVEDVRNRPVDNLRYWEASRSTGRMAARESSGGSETSRSMNRALRGTVGEFERVDDRSPDFEAVASRISLGAVAVFVHDNLVVAPTGPALSIRAIGSVSVEGNVLVSRGVAGLDLASILRSSRSTTSSSKSMKTTNAAATSGVLATLGAFLGGAVVTIIDLGVSAEIYGRAAGFTSLGETSLMMSRSGFLGIAGLLVGGEILFNDNRVRLEPAVDTGRPLCSVLLLSLDDVSMEGNQSACGFQLDAITTNSIAAGWSVRVADNRFQEGLLATSVSAVSLGMMNSTTDNQSTHCLLVIGHPALTVRDPNRALTEITGDERCALLQRFGELIGNALFGTIGRHRIIEEEGGRDVPQ